MNINDENSSSKELIIELEKHADKKEGEKENLIEKMSTSEERFEVYDTPVPNNKCLRLKMLFNYLDKLDKRISKPLQTYTPNFKIECLFFIFAKLFNTETIMIYLASILVYSLVFRNFIIFAISFTHVFVGFSSTMILKKIFGRNRPTLTVKRYFISVRKKEKHKSMPSGDSVQAGIFTTMIVLYFNFHYKYTILLLIPAVMSGRVYYNCHYWFDCIIGAILGITITIVTYKTIKKLGFIV